MKVFGSGNAFERLDPEAKEFNNVSADLWLIRIQQINSQLD
jgi:hypothetical protein